MKKLVFAAFALMVLAGTTFTPNFSNTAVASATTIKKPATQPDQIPPPGCPLNSPDGCGIYS